MKKFSSKSFAIGKIELTFYQDFTRFELTVGADWDGYTLFWLRLFFWQVEVRKFKK